MPGEKSSPLSRGETLAIIHVRNRLFPSEGNRSNPQRLNPRKPRGRIFIPKALNGFRPVGDFLGFIKNQQCALALFPFPHIEPGRLPLLDEPVAIP